MILPVPNIEINSRTNSDKMEKPGLLFYLKKLPPGEKGLQKM